MSRFPGPNRENWLSRLSVALGLASVLWAISPWLLGVVSLVFFLYLLRE